MLRARGALVGVVAFSAVLALRRFAPLPSVLYAGLALLLLVGIPTSRELSRRLAMNGVLALGWIPALWWIHFPTWTAGRVSVILAVSVGGVAGWLASAEKGRGLSRLRSVVPRTRVIDLAPFIAIAIAIYEVAPWLRPLSPLEGVGGLDSGWDSAAHFNVYYLIRRFGVAPWLAGSAPDSSPWQFEHYPSNFHSMAAALSELTHGAIAAPPTQEAAYFLTSSSIVFVACAAIAVSAACSVPILRRRPLPGLLSAALVLCVFVGGMGPAFLLNANANFVFALALGVAASLIASSLPRPFIPLPLAAVAGAQVGIANSWPPLLVVAGPAAALLLVPWRRSRYKAGRRDLLLIAAIAAATVFGMIQAFNVFAQVGSTNFLTIPGYTPGTSLLRALAVNAAVLVLAFGASRSGAGRDLRGDLRLRAVHSSIPVILGLGTALVFAVVELRQGGALSYYFWKFIAGEEVLAVGLLITLLAYHVENLTEPRRTVRYGFIPLMTALTAWLAVASPQARTEVRTQESWLPASQLISYSRLSPVKDAPTLGRLLAATPLQDPGLQRVSVYITLAPPDTVNPALLEEWYRALTNTWSVHAMFCSNVPPFALRGMADAKQVVIALAKRCTESDFVVNPQTADPLRRALGDPSLSSRVVTWPSG